jgi:crossover junction endodeoxyribonuclease RuvC
MDPGTNVMGYGVLAVRGHDLHLLQFGVFHLAKYSGHELKLKKIFERVSGIIEEFKPDEVAIEAPFYGKNIQSMLKLGRAQGVAMAAVLSRGIPIVEYAPKRVKQSVTGNGNASKEQVAKMLQSVLPFDETPKLLDATDALAVALCHHYSASGPTRKSKSWRSFLNDNPDRLI